MYVVFKKEKKVVYMTVFYLPFPSLCDFRESEWQKKRD